MRYDDELVNGQNVYDPNPIRCIALSIALIYYFRLPTREDNVQRNDHRTPSREDFAELIHVEIQEFDQVIQNELERFVTTKNFVIPPGVAINQAVSHVSLFSPDRFELSFQVREHIFTIVVSIVTRTPLCIIGVPGQSFLSLRARATVLFLFP